MNALVTFRLCKLSNEDLLKKVNEGIDNLYIDGKIPARNIPARPDADFDLLVGELIMRFKERDTTLTMTNTNQQEQLYSEDVLRAGISAGLQVGSSPNYKFDNREQEIENILNSKWFKKSLPEQSPYTPPVEDGKLGGESKEQIFEKCRLYAEDLMYSKSWDRKDAEMVGVFYKFFIDKLWEYLKSQPSTPSAEDGWVSVKDVTDITDPTQICPELDYKISRFSRDLIDTVMESYAMGDSYIKRDHKVFKLVFYFINTINHPLPSPPVNKQPL